MSSKFEEPTYQVLRYEPVTSNEVAKKFVISHKTASRALMHFPLTRQDVYYKNSGRVCHKSGSRIETIIAT